MNEIQKVIFDMFLEFKSVCEKLNLKWYLINGSALGAVKYGGFIPWDDDMDVGLPRKDYEIFIKEAQKLLPEYIFVQNAMSDKNFPHVYTKLRNSNTTFIECGVKRLDMNHGIYLDVFPLDYFPDDLGEQKKIMRKEKLLYWKTVCVFDDKSKLKIRLRNNFFKFLGYDKRTDKTIAKIHKLISGYEKSDYICNYSDRMPAKRVMPKEYYGDGKIVLFEEIEVFVPWLADEYLTFKYGDWRKELPKENQKSHHISEICDINKSFKEYI